MRAPGMVQLTWSSPPTRTCGAPIVLEFPNAAERLPAITAIVVDAREVACEPTDDGAVRCELAEEFYGVPDTYRLTVEVDGLAPIELAIELPASQRCCACSYEGVTVEVELSDVSDG
jgi:hypothetical protein